MTSSKIPKVPVLGEVPRRWTVTDAAVDDLREQHKNSVRDLTYAWNDVLRKTGAVVASDDDKARAVALRELEEAMKWWHRAHDHMVQWARALDVLSVGGKR